MATYNNGSLILKDAEGNVVHINSLSANDISKIQAVITESAANAQAVTQIQESLEELQTSIVDNLGGLSPLAYADYTQAGNQGGMIAGVYYRVPFNAADQFILFDEETGQASASQADGTTDTTVDHFKIVYKNSSGSVSELGTIDFVMNLDEYYTKTQVDSAISSAVSAGVEGALTLAILSSAPGSDEELKENTLYAYPASDSI